MNRFKAEEEEEEEEEEEFYCELLLNCATRLSLLQSRWSSTVPRCLPITEEQLAECPVLKTNPIIQAECTLGQKE